jgi:hypothetical protein
MQAVSKQLAELLARKSNHLHSRLTVKHCAHNLAFLLIKAHSFTFDCKMLPGENVCVSV